MQGTLRTFSILASAAVGSFAVCYLWRRRRWPHGQGGETHAEHDVGLVGGGAKGPIDAERQQAPGCCSVRVGGMKVSRLRRMIEDLAEEMMGGARRGAVAEAPPVAQLASPEGDLDLATWDDQVLMEKRTMEAAATIIRDVRRSEVHRSMAHFYAVDRQLQVIEHQLASIAMSVQSFWRYGRDTPMRDLLVLPLMRLAETGGEGAVLPVSLGFVKLGGARERLDPLLDCALLGVPLGADREAIESAFRRRSRHFHRRGTCCNEGGFHELAAARSRCLARLSCLELPEGTGGDLLAHYLLVGTDPGESRYRERALGILDSAHREALLRRIQVLQWPSWDIPLTWGDEDDMIGFGGANHMGASG